MDWSWLDQVRSFQNKAGHNLDVIERQSAIICWLTFACVIHALMIRVTQHPEKRLCTIGDNTLIETLCSFSSLFYCRLFLLSLLYPQHQVDKRGRGGRGVQLRRMPRSPAGGVHLAERGTMRYNQTSEFSADRPPLWEPLSLQWNANGEAWISISGTD